MTNQEAKTLRVMLEQRNAALLRDWVELEVSLSRSNIPALLVPYRAKIVSYCRGYRLIAEVNRQLLQLRDDTILDDLLSRTQQATYDLRFVSGRFASPILRSMLEDALCLKILTWIHQSHHLTSAIPAAFASGDVAVWPFMRVVPIYFFPSIEQGGLLFQPLHYHEFGHGIYVLYKTEMDDLIKELQVSIEKVLTPLSQRNDEHSKKLFKKRQVIIKRWFSWAQEIFCDAVGLTMGGPAYLYAFSAYCNDLSKSDLYLTAEDLERSKHPVTWLRIRFLVKRAKGLGFQEAASRVDQEWNTLASVMHVTEDYHGYFENTMERDIHRIIDDMLLVAGPRQFQPDEVAGQTTSEQEVTPKDTSVSLLNLAWHIYNQDPDAYADWEKQAIKAYLA